MVFNRSWMSMVSVERRNARRPGQRSPYTIFRAHSRSRFAWLHFLMADQVAFSSKPAYTAVPFIAVGLSIVPL